MKLIKMSFGMIRKFNRHYRIQLRYLTFSKLVNLLKASKSYLLRETTISSKPCILKIESSSFCNLRCLGCRTDKSSEFVDGTIPIERYKAIIDELQDSLLEVVLYLWGEPFINKNLVQMVRYATDKNIGSVISTNLHFMSEETAKGLIESKLDKIIICIDGMDQQTYERIRIGGDHAKVMENLHTLVNVRSELKSKQPMIEWQYVLTDFNAHQVPEAKELAKKLGVDEFTIMEDLSPRNFDEALKREKKRNKNILEKRCPWLWFATNIQWDGKIYPCCHYARNTNYSVGQVTDDVPFIQSFNSEQYIQSRRRFSKNPPEVRGKNACYICPFYNTSNSKKE